MNVRNLTRAVRAQRAVYAYRGLFIDGQKDLNSGELEEAIQDLVCDLQHLCDLNDFDWEAVKDRGDMHYIAEHEGEEDEA
jgi:hypothetical protein